MKNLLANDLVIQEDNCNLSCRYCLTGQSTYKEGHLDKMIFQPPRKSDCAPGSTLRARIDRIIQTSTDRMNLPILKITGGEIFLVKGMMEMVEELSAHFATLVVQTNGVLVTPNYLERLAALGNICLQISLDGTSYEANAYRSNTRDLHTKIYSRLDAIFKFGIPTEIYCVLNNQSLPELASTLNDLKQYGEHLSVFPFPVRGPDSSQFQVTPEQISVLSTIWEHYDDFQPVMPPRAYWQRLMRFYHEGGRNFSCHLPRFAFTTFDDGFVTSCPNIWFNKIGNMVTQETETVVESVGNTPFHQILLAPKPRLDACKGCFTPWDTLSMFMDHEITLDELCSTPMYRASAVRQRLQEIYSEYWESKTCLV
ncbi:MAG TPA: radical SAM protein [Candidatus Angelobacter sp.]|nr:radical SAM protein [Candidatus Angelobacter sp.]